ncbi:MAG: metallophosphoesterase [Phycisphaerae bacterium]|nr:metallophosphoesterase [Phycisphaerae bacterium]
MSKTRYVTAIARAIGILSILASCLVASSAFAEGVAADAHRSDPGNKAPFAPFIFIQAGDPQMGFGASLEQDKAMFAKLGEHARRAKVPFVLVCGDLIHKGTDQEKRAFDEALATFQVPVRLIPGNHDIGAMPALRRYRECYGEDYHAFTYNNCTFVGIDTMTLLGPSPKKDASSTDAAAWKREGERQWRWLAKTLAEAKRANRTHVFLFMHHPPFVANEDEKDEYYNWPLECRKRLIELVRRYGVKVILNGHTHKTYTVQSADKTFAIYSVAGTGKAFDKQGLGYRLVRVGPQSVESEFIRLDQP